MLTLYLTALRQITIEPSTNVFFYLTVLPMILSLKVIVARRYKKILNCL
jgi:hypothetical protein